MTKKALLTTSACLLLVAGGALAQEETHCAAVFTTDIGPLMVQSNGAWQTVSRNCSPNPSCDDYFDLECDEGAEIDLSFCEQGGGSNFDTGLSIWSEENGQEACNDDACAGFQAALSGVLPLTTVYRVRVGAQELDQAGSYTLAYRFPVGCSIIGGIPVELQSFDVEK